MRRNIACNAIVRHSSDNTYIILNTKRVQRLTIHFLDVTANYTTCKKCNTRNVFMVVPDYALLKAYVIEVHC